MNIMNLWTLNITESPFRTSGKLHLYLRFGPCDRRHLWCIWTNLRLVGSQIQGCNVNVVCRQLRDRCRDGTWTCLICLLCLLSLLAFFFRASSLFNAFRSSHHLTSQRAQFGTVWHVFHFSEDKIFEFNAESANNHECSPPDANSLAKGAMWAVFVWRCMSQQFPNFWPVCLLELKNGILMSCRFRLIRVVTSKQPCRRLQRCCRGLRHLFPLLLCSTLHLSQRSPSSVEPKRSRCQLRGAFGTYSVRPCAITKTCTSCTGIFEFNFLAASQLAWLTKPGDGINVDIGHCNFHEPATPQIWRQESLLLLYSEVVPNLLERQKHVENLGAWMLPLLKAQSYARGLSSCQKNTSFYCDRKRWKRCFVMFSIGRLLCFRNE